MQEVGLARYARLGSRVIHILMGWRVMAAVVLLRCALTPAGFAGLASGSICCTRGIVFHAPDQRVRHGLQHLCVPGGSICHFFTVLLYAA